MSIKVEKIVYPGKALGRGEDGIAVFIEGAPLPGEVVEVKVTKSKKSFKEARLESVIEASPLRRAPVCPSFGKCGGCSFQHTDYAHQLELKEGCVRELLRNFSVPVEPITASPSEWGYRNKMEFSFYQDAAGVHAGLHEKNEFNRYFPVPPCHICDPDFLPVTEFITAFANRSGLVAYDKRNHQGFYRHLVLRKGVRTGDLLVNLVTNAAELPKDFFAPLVEGLKDKVTSLYWTVNGSFSDAVVADSLTLLHGKEMIEEKLSIKGREYAFSVSPFSFFQTNTLGTEKLYETVIDLLGGDENDVLLDLYCGTGTIGIVLSPFVKAVSGVELVPSAIENAGLNAKKNNVSNIAFSVGSVEKWIRHGDKPVFNALVVDPPRGGLTPKVVDFIAQSAPAKLVYVSCNPATLARDLADIVSKGGYRIDRIVPVDMFPQTFHVETVVALSLNGKA